MKRLLLASALFASQGIADPAMDEPIPGVDNAPEEFEVDMTAFNALVDHFKTDPDYAGSKIGVRVGDQFAVVDRSLEKASASTKKPTVTPAGTSVLDRLVGAASNSTAARASFHISYKKKGIDENGKPYEETLEIDAGAASGAAAAAQASMDEAMSKNHQ